MKIDFSKASEATVECSISPDIECFFCGLCEWARNEDKYYNEWIEEERRRNDNKEV
jgi:hypothetical protein